MHNSKRFSSEHLSAYYDNREVPEDRDAHLRKLAKEARDEIRRAAEIGSFVLSDRAQEIIRNYERDIENTEDITMWHDYLEHDHDTTDKCLKEFLKEAKRDLVE